EVKRQGFRTVYEPEAISIEETNQHSTDEFRMRVRIIVQTLRVLSHYRSVLNPLKYGLFACQMLSHKVLRYAVPFFLLIAFVSALLLRNQSVLYWWACFVQIGFYLLALLAWCGERLKVRLGPLAIPFFFILVNLATIIALLKFIKGDTQSRWEPVRRQQTSQT
ncbi:MAG TPA: glycosyltransferase family 2 protein, partial [Blastocatellia bacterium]|nr:glycosyltransferase family 2 protein [Blastocatellia bacterium]